MRINRCLLLLSVTAFLIMALLYYYVFTDWNWSPLYRMQNGRAEKFAAPSQLAGRPEISTAPGVSATTHIWPWLLHLKEEPPRAKTVEEKQVRWRMSEYCNPITVATLGAEGELLDGFQLEHVHVIIRHGDRSPIYSVPNQPHLTLSCNMNLSMLRQESIIKDYTHYMKKLLRRLLPVSSGVRFGLYPHSAKCEGAQLTGQGAAQHLHNGLFLRHIYNTKLGLFGGKDPHKKIVVKTTEYTRTYQSAIAFLFGFIPHFDFHSLNIKFTKMLNFCSSQNLFNCDCPMVYKLQGVVQKEYSKRTQNSTLYHDIKSRLSKILDVHTSKLPWVMAIIDALSAYTCHNKPLPCSKKNSRHCISWNLIQDMWKFVDFNGRSQLSSFANLKMSALSMHPLLHELYDRMNNVSKKQETSKFYLYSGHDTTMTSITTALGIHDGQWPSYASRLIFELYSGLQENTRVYFIKILYNGIDLTHKVKFCKYKPLPHGLCPLEYFESFVKFENMKVFGKSAYNVECIV